ncbi:Ig-like domain-containing protein, partial [Clostridium sp. DJ247]|uniref:Ig-like domain-containing protein n=1 Tax=Clostridium sp. DJ247 TaxID=2726188 RepID=UPI00162442B5|nr:hypothetical protein [Clostridium sp. DJ247]
MSDGTSQDVTSSTVWSTSNANLATVDANGFVTIPSTATNGTVYIRGTYNGKGAATTITISAPVFSSLRFNPSTATLGRGNTLQINSSAVMSDGTSQDVTASTVWSTSNANLATVDANGFVTVPSTATSGTVYIRGTYNGKGAATTITISAPTFSSLRFNPSTATLRRGNTLQINSSAVMSDGTSQDVTASTVWSTSNANLATVDANGFVTIPSTATNSTVYIRGTYNGKGAATTITIQIP